MKTKNYVLSLLLMLFTISLNSQTLNWGKSFGGDGEDVLRSLHVDVDGNIYSTGYFVGTADFGMGDEQFILTSDGDLYDTFVQKVDANGNFLWAKRFGNSGWEYGVSITSDASGNVYIAGAYEGSVDFDPGHGEYILTALGILDMFVVKLDPSGNFIWAKSMGGVDYEEIVEIKMTNSGALLVMGYFSSPIDADPSTEERILNTQGIEDVFLILLNESGDLIEAKSFGGTGFELGMDMKIDSNGSIFITGMFYGTTDLDPSETEEYNLTSDDFGVSGYLVVLDSDLNFQYAYSTYGGVVTPRALTIAHDGSSYITGDFRDSVNFGSVNGVDIIFDALTAPNTFVLKLDSTGNLKWVKIIAAEEPVFGMSIVANATHVFASGFYENQTDFNPTGTEEFILEVESMNATDAFLAIYTIDGEFLNAVNFGGVDYMDAHKMVMDSNGDLILGAQYGNTIDIDPNPANVVQMTAVDFRDTYILKFSLENLGVGEEVLKSVKIYPNPTNDRVQIKGFDTYNTSYVILDMLGREMKQGNLSNNNSVSFEEFSKGTYMLIIDNIHKFKVIKN